MRLRLACALAGAALLGGVAVSCSSPEKLQGEGGRCFVVTDCELGFACVQQADGSRRCSTDLTPIQMPAEAGGAMIDAAPQDGAGDAGGGDAATPMGDSAAPQDTGSPPPPDTGAPPQDTGAPPPPDTGSPQEAGAGTDASSD